MTPQQSPHTKLVEDVAKLTWFIDEHGHRLPREPASAAKAILALIASRLSEVTPEMVEAAEDAWAARIKDKARRGFVGTANPQESFKDNWRAMLAASCLTPPK